MSEYAEILIIDDEPEMISFSGEMLKNEGYHVAAAINAETAFEYLENHFPDLIILDINMEGMNGIEMCRKLKKQIRTADIPVVFLTAENSPEIIKQGFNAGGCDYIIKPFIREEYLARVKTHLKISRNAHELSAVNHELKQFCSAVSHDLKSPLNVLNMLISSLDEELGDKKDKNTAEIMNMIQDKSQKTILMIERLLEFSKMCNVVPEIEIINTEEMIKDIFYELKSLEPERNIQFEMNDIADIKGDSVLIEMLFKNIISNAVKFTRYKEKAIISVSSEKNKDYTIIKIKDNGTGFDMKYADKLFNVFQRLHSEDEFEGTGVGLALSERIMKRHGGMITAFGETDKGTEITLYFKSI